MFYLNEMICTSLHLYLQHKKVPVRHTGAYRQKKSTGIVANVVANVIAALITYQLPTLLVQFMTQFPVILLNDLSIFTFS